MAKVSWDEIEKSVEGYNTDTVKKYAANNANKQANGGGGNTPFPKRELRFITLGSKAIGKTILFRPLGTPKTYYKYLIKGEDGKYRSAIVEDNLNNPVTVNHSLEPQLFFSMNVIDREDGLIKIIEGQVGKGILEKLIDYKKMTGNNPGGIESGADFKLFVSGKKGSYYQTDMDQKVALTSEEKEMVRTEGLYELDRIFKPTPNENLEDKLYGAAPVKPTNNPNIQKKVATNFSNQNEFEMDDEKKPAKVASSKQDDDMDF